ncbi:MAG: zinc ribbon domain-containing protein [Clostridia bacterium]|nr:zinc ribbon domain-containing protein [Clostridia bacterium]
MKKVLSFVLSIVVLLLSTSCGETVQSFAKYCATCGNGMMANDAFCSNCGAEANSSITTSVSDTKGKTTVTPSSATSSTTSTTTKPMNYDYSNAESFENALNNGNQVANCIVRFEVKGYKSDSAFGYNCWAGEHLNFISEEALSVHSGSVVIGRITEEPARFLGSWIVFYEVWQVDEKVIVNTSVTTKTTTTSKKTTTSTTHSTTSPTVNYSTNDKKTVKNGNSGIYAYKNLGATYDVYWIIDFDQGYVFWFADGNGDECVDKVKIDSGTLNSVLIVTYHDNETSWSYGLHFKYKNQPDHLIVQDNNGFENDFYPTNLQSALKLMSKKTVLEF